MALTILAISFFGLLILGVPVAFAIGLSALVTILYEGLPLAVLFQQMMSGMNIFSFLAIPFFVFSGELMLHGGIADKIVAAATIFWAMPPCSISSPLKTKKGMARNEKMFIPDIICWKMTATGRPS